MIRQFFSDYWPLLLAVTNLVLACWATLHAVLRKRDSRAVIGWVALAWMVPIIGALAYFGLGVNRIQRKAIALRIGEGLPTEVEPELNASDYRMMEEQLARNANLKSLAALGRTVTDSPLLPGNAVDVLLDGDGAYPAMLAAIEGAERSITLLSYIFDNDRAGQAFLDALGAAFARGVEIRVLVDHVGSRYSKPPILNPLREMGIPTATFLPTRWVGFNQYANLRNHRKILVVDGVTGFTGGTNIREGHWLSLEPGEPVQCTHFRLQGPVVAHLQEVFAIDWDFTTGEALSGERWFPHIERAGPVGARGIADGPDEDFENMAHVILGALATANESVRITSPYFLPDSPVIQALNITAMRGVSVDIVIPEKINIAPVQWATWGILDQVLVKGCRVHLSAPPFDHSKLLVVDGVWALIGSTNWDPRSLRLNFEFNVECYNPELACELEALIDDKIARGKPVTQQTVAARPLPIKFRDGLARLASPYL